MVNMIFNNTYIGKSRLRKTMLPVSGYKKSRLMTDSYGKVYINAIQGPQGCKKVDLNSFSQCPNVPVGHAGNPSRFCTCGFYAYTTLDEALGHLQDSHFDPILKTVASGKVIMYEKGIRSAQQRVEEVIFHECSSTICKDPADRISIRTGYGAIANEIVAYCEYHGNNRSCETFDWLEQQMSLSLRNGEPPIKVRSLDPNIVPWNGGKRMDMVIDTLNKQSTDHAAKANIATGLLGLTGLGIISVAASQVISGAVELFP